MNKNWDKIANDTDSEDDSDYSDEDSAPLVFIDHNRGYVRADPSPSDSQIFSPVARRKRWEESGKIAEFSDDETVVSSVTSPPSDGSDSSATATAIPTSTARPEDKDNKSGPSLRSGDEDEDAVVCEIWMERSKYWEGMAGVWKPIKCIGKGGYGIVGLFEYVREDKDGMPRNIGT